MAININSIPADLASIPNWTRSTGLDSSPQAKVPLWADTKDAPRSETNQTLISLIPFLTEHPAYNAGIFTSIHNQLIVVDLDDLQICQRYLDQHDPDLNSLLPHTYTEFSLNNKLHLYYLYQNKSFQYPAYCKHPIDTHLGEGQTSIHSNFMVVTGKKAPISAHSLYSLTDEEFQKITSLPISHEERAQARTAISALQPKHDSPSATIDTPEDLEELIQALKLIPLNQSSKIKLAWEALTGRTYEHYDFWLSIGMAMHSSVSQKLSMKAALAFDEWSSTDPTHYTGSDSCIQKWSSFNAVPHDRYLTKATIFALSQEMRMQFPVMRTTQKGARVPDVEAIRNYLYFMKYHNLKIYSDFQSYYISGDSEILTKHFNMPFVLPQLMGPFEGRDFKTRLATMVQETMFPTGHITVKAAQMICKILIEQAITPNLFDMWVKSNTSLTPQYSANTRPLLPVPPRTPPTSWVPTIDQLMKFIEFDESQDIEIARAILYASFMLIIKLNCFPEIGMDSAEGFLYLTGPQSSYKSTFCESLVPYTLKKYLVRSLTSVIRSEKGLRDFQLALASSPFLVIDEAEGFINFQESSSQFKAIMSKAWLDVTPIYSSDSVRLQRKAFVLGSSNDYEQRMMRNGTRKMWWVRVQHIHTEDLIYFNWHAFYRQMKHEFELLVAQGKQPWILPQDIMKRLDESNVQGTAMTEVDMILRECFPIDDSFKARDVLLNITSVQASKLLLTAKQLTTLIQMRWPDFHGSLPAVKNAARRYAMEYLQTGVSQSLVLNTSTARFIDGVVQTGTGRALKTYYIVPWTLEEVQAETFKEFMTK